MDEEDIREAEESKRLSTAEVYAGFGFTDDEPNRREAFMDIFRPTGETIGVKLLKKMGWKEGQGIGPKVRRKANLEETEDDNHEARTTHLFAPEDPPLISINRKFDHKGLGWKGESGLRSESNRLYNPKPLRRNEEDTDDDNQTAITFSKGGRNGAKAPKDKRGAFGVGILNDTGSDDEDPYQMGPKISYNRVIGGDKGLPKKGDRLQAASNPLLKERPIFVSKTTKGRSGFRKCHDGRLPLDGFVLSTELDSSASLHPEDEKYDHPKVPEGWVSKKQSSGGHFGERYVSTAVTPKLSDMDAKKRAALLGEEQMPGKSVFDFLSPAARDQIVALSGRTNLPAGLGERPPEGFGVTDVDRHRLVQDLVPKLDAEVAMQALNRGVGGWMPYAEDEEKRDRYRAFLEIRAGIRGGLPERLEGMGKSDWINEMHEFARAAQVFRPVTGMMASRFTSSSLHPQLASDRPEPSANGEALMSHRPSEHQDPAANAAKMGMFGPLTRSVRNFYPTKLLCKRFNVKPPAHVRIDPGAGLGKDAAVPVTSNTKFQSAGYQMQSIRGLPEKGDLGLAGPTFLQSSSEASLESRTRTSGAAPTVQVDPERNGALEAERPGDEVFRAIFGSDEEDD